MLRCATWLAPGLPVELFETVSAAVADALATDVELVSFTEASGPPVHDDPFRRQEFDLGFLCGPSYRELAAEPSPSVVLAGVAPVFCDPRNGGQPVYFSEFLVRGHDRATTPRDLLGARIGYNDPRSMSGYVALQQRLAQLGLDDGCFTMVRTGGHRRSLELLGRGELDAAAIDSNTLLDLDALPDGVRVLESWGPFPVQPVVVRSSLLDRTRRVIATTLLALHENAAMRRTLRRFHVERFAEVTEDDYR